MDNRKLHQIKNWKLKEIIDQIEIVADKSQDFLSETLDKLNIPKSPNVDYVMWNRTQIWWESFNIYYKFMYYREGIEDIVKNNLLFALKDHGKIIITYGIDEPTVKIPYEIFCESWDQFIASTVWQTVIFSEDYKLIMEANTYNDFYSNFEILKE